ncbi:DNA polymerase [Clostridia bacterium]|nr:DNA polymerase [Clostridia bacterium]
MKTLLVLDGNSIINREYYGMPPLTNSRGEMVNALLGFMNRILRNIEVYHPDYTVAAFDLPAPTFRHKAFDGYKASRKGMPDDLASQLPLVKEMCEICGFGVVTCEGYEADDILGDLSKIGGERGVKTYLLTGDRDSFQLVTDNVSVLYASNKSVEEYTPQRIREVYGVEPRQMIDVKSLMGDASDEIPGVPGIGEKTALNLIKSYGSLDGVYTALEDGDKEISAGVAKKLTEGKDKAYLSRTLAEICTDVPCDLSYVFDKNAEIDRAKLYDFCSRYELKSIIKKLDLLPAKDSAAAPGGFTLPDDVGALYETVSAADICERFAPGSTLFVTLIIAENAGEQIQFDDDASEIFVTDGKTYLRAEFYTCSDLSSFFARDYKFAFDDLKRICKNIQATGFDFSLAGYVLDPTDTVYDTASLAAKYLHAEASVITGTAANFTLPALYDEMTERLNSLGLMPLLTDVEIPLASLLADLESRGFMVDAYGLRAYGAKLSDEIKAVQSDIFADTGHEFNINSPKQLGEMLFDTLRLPFGKKNKSGSYHTDIDVLNQLAQTFPVAKNVLQYRMLTKLKSTFCDGLLKILGADGRLRTSFNQTVTATGRLSSTEPNLQNIPIRTPHGHEIRKYFIAPRGFTLIDADYSQIELRVLAHISGDETLIKAFGNELDIHTVTASEVFGVAESKVTKEQRSRAKAVNFGIVYGISDFSLAEDIGVSVAEAKLYIEEYFKRYPSVKRYMEEIVQTARDKGYVSTILGRIRYIPELRAPNKNTASFGARIARNTPIQGSAADIIKLAMIACEKRLKREGLKSKLILQVHDELIFESPEDEAETVESIVKQEMESVLKLSVPIKTDVSSGATWYDAKA